MSAQMPKTDYTPTDVNKPNAGRMYDYFLGGSHNFESDRQAAAQVIKLLPWVPKFARLQRACLQDVGEELSNTRGYDVIIDLASGLPTQDHIHKVAKPGTLVIYSDRDPLVVEYGREVLKDTENAYIFESDARTPDVLLNNPKVIELLKGRRDVALVLWGVTGFMTEAEIEGTVKSLYNWAGPKSTFAFMAQGTDVATDNPKIAEIMTLYQRMGTPLLPKPMAEYYDLIKPWRLDPPGWVSLLNWHNLDEDIMTAEDKGMWTNSGGGYGAYLVK